MSLRHDDDDNGDQDDGNNINKHHNDCNNIHGKRTAWILHQVIMTMTLKVLMMTMATYLGLCTWSRPVTFAGDAEGGGAILLKALKGIFLKVENSDDLLISY